MTFDEMCRLVTSIVKRPDMADDIKSAVRNATLKAHRTNFFYRDLAEQSIQFAEPSFVHNFDPRDIFGSQFRKIAYIRRWIYDPNDTVRFGSPGAMLDMVGFQDLTDYWGVRKTDVFYQSGHLQQIRTSEPLQHALVGAFIIPKTAEDVYSSWVAEEYPHAIICEAARFIASSTGNAALAEVQRALAVENYAQMALESAHEPGE